MPNIVTKKKRFATRAVHPAGQIGIEGRGKPIATPIVQSASFFFEDTEDLAVALAKPSTAFSYSRVGNPTLDVLERTVADLEDAEAGLAFGSGMAAIHAVAVALCAAGDHVVAPASLYGGTFTLFKNLLARFGVEVTFADLNDHAAVKAAIRKNTKMLYAETISNPSLTVADLPALAAIAKEARVPLVVDSTFASPYLVRPMEHGADLVIHSATKYLGGHGDLIGGVVAGRSALIAEVKKIQVEVGGVLDPFTGFLLLRGIQTLALRMDRHCSSALKIAEFLEGHEMVQRVIYPGLKSHPFHAVAKRMLPRGFGGMVAFEVGGGRAGGAKVLHALQVFLRAASLGDTHSLAIQPAATSHRQMSADELAKAGISEGFIRLSVGIEDPEDLIADLAGALA